MSRTTRGDATRPSPRVTPCKEASRAVEARWVVPLTMEVKREAAPVPARWSDVAVVVGGGGCCGWLVVVV